MTLSTRYVYPNPERNWKLCLYQDKLENMPYTLFSLLITNRFSAENQPMMDNSSGYKKTLSIESISNEDLENNNNNNVKNKKSTLYKDESAVQYSSNSKGVFAQVRRF